MSGHFTLPFLWALLCHGGPFPVNFTLVYGLDGLGISTIGNPKDWIDINPTHRSFPHSFWTLKNFVVTNCVTTRYYLKTRHVVTCCVRCCSCA